MLINRRKQKLFWKKHGKAVAILGATIIGCLFLFGINIPKATAPELISPEPTLIPVQITPTATPTPTSRPTRGRASYYSLEGCIGCREDRTMANGQKLDDTKLTLAYNHLPLNTWVKIMNTKTGQIVRAQITDRGGFERHGKIADLSVATRDALGCGDVCEIQILTK